MKIIFFETMPGEEEYFRGSAALPPGSELEFLIEPLNADTAAQAAGADVVCVFVKSAVDRGVIDTVPGLRLIVTRSTGYDHVDWQYAKSKGIPTANVPSYGAHTVAEFAFGLMLMLSRKLYQASHQLREGMDFTQRSLQGFDLNGKTLGVLGTGRIGKNVIGIAHGFGMEVLAFDAYPDQAFAQTAKFSYVPLEQLLAKSDIVTIHVPYTPETHHLMNAGRFRQLKKGAFLINTARGDIIDTPALITALKDGTVAGAGLDVLEGERELVSEMELLSGDSTHPADFRQLATDALLIDLPNVIVTPHVAFNTREAMHEIMRVVSETIGGWASGKEQKFL
ncbi:MAG TPA: NAD(P)-dependent oxidoreductase [Candidatus Paceibacterota bacterium]|nr:NAD(P)-dependent oxidoreductase [Candidatus Paceibacterota bacterium]